MYFIEKTERSALKESNEKKEKKISWLRAEIDF